VKLGVNIDHVATLREARGVDYPAPVDAVPLCLKGGASGITIHLREDRRHIKDADVRAVRRALPGGGLNLEMANVPDVLAVALRERPDEACLVPERRREVTTEGGLDAAGQLEALRPTVRALREAGVRVSLFIAPEIPQLEAALELGAPVVELHTGRYCNVSGADREAELDRLAAAAEWGHARGLQINAGHGLNLANLGGFLRRVPHLDTLNIGHSIVSRAVFTGLEEAVREMIAAMAAATRA